MLRPEIAMFVTTEHVTLQSARAAGVVESTNRAAIFIGSVSAGIVALGLIATVTHVGTAFYAFGLILLATLACIGFATFAWMLQSGIEDYEHAERIARLRAYYFDRAPEMTRYLASVPPEWRLAVQGVRGGRWQVLRAVTGMIGLVTAVLAGSAAGMLTVLASGRSLVTGFVTDGLVSVAVLAALIWHQHRAWHRVRNEWLFGSGQEEPEAG